MIQWQKGVRHAMRHTRRSLRQFPQSRAGRSSLLLFVSVILVFQPGCTDDDSTEPPPVRAEISDLQIESVSPDGAHLAWTPPGLPGRTVEVRYSLGSIEAGNWRVAISAHRSASAATHPDSRQRTVVPHLYTGITYYFAARTWSSDGDTSDVSNCPHASGRLPLPETSHWFTGFTAGAGPDAPVRALVEYQGELVIGGEFEHVGGLTAAHIARFDGVAWHPLGAGLDGLVTGLAAEGDDLYAVGCFLASGETPASRVARWDGVAWHSLGDGVPGCPSTVTVHLGRPVLGFPDTADRGVYTWDGSEWAEMPPAGGGAPGMTVCFLEEPEGLLAGGEYVGTHGSFEAIRRWNGSAWSAHPAAQPPFIVIGLHRHGGDLVATLFPGSEDYPDGEPMNQRWTGGRWAPLNLTRPAPSAHGPRAVGGFIVATLDGQAIAVGEAATGEDGAVMRLQGDSWLPIGTLNGLDLDWPTRGVVVQGRLHIGGDFQRVSGISSPYLARWDG